MKKLKIIFLFVVFFATGTVLISCGNGASKTDKAEQPGKEYTSAYICPMHCKDSGSDEAGKCPVCGMDYVKNENHKSDGHNH